MPKVLFLIYCGAGFQTKDQSRANQTSRAFASSSKREFNVGNPDNGVGKAEKPGKKGSDSGISQSRKLQQALGLDPQKRGGAVTRTQEMESVRGGWHCGRAALEPCRHPERRCCPQQDWVHRADEAGQNHNQKQSEQEKCPHLTLCPPPHLPPALPLAEPARSPSVWRA